MLGGSVSDACVFRATSNGIEEPFLFAWRPDAVPGESQFWDYSAYGSGLNLQRGAKAVLCRLTLCAE